MISFEEGKIDQILTELQSLMLLLTGVEFKSPRDNDLLARVETIYEQLHEAVIASRLGN